MEEKDLIIKDLKEKLDMEIRVKQNEVLINKEYKDLIEKLELHNETLIEINEKYSTKIGKLRNQLKNLVIKVDPTA